MAVATGSASMDAQDILCFAKGTIQEVIDEITTGTDITANWRCLNIQEAMKHFTGTGTSWMTWYIRSKP